MGKFFTANEELKNYLVKLGLTCHARNPEDNREVSYFTDNKSGKQVKVNTQANFIVLMCEQGYEEDSSSSFTNNQIESFLNN